jgi:hypothetical protein
LFRHGLDNGEMALPGDPVGEPDVVEATPDGAGSELTDRISARMGGIRSLFAASDALVAACPMAPLRG